MRSRNRLFIWAFVLFIVVAGFIALEQIARRYKGMLDEQQPQAAAPAHPSRARRSSGPTGPSGPSGPGGRRDGSPSPAPPGAIW